MVATKKLVIGVLVAVLLTALVLGIYFGLRNSSDPACNSDEPSYKNAVIVTNGKECAAIGRDILKRNGSIADAAIAALFCEGVACLQSMGLGGGFFLTMYTKATNTIETLDARETAPAKAHRDMFNGNTTASQIGGLSVAVPGELKGYWELHQKHGLLPWKELILPTIELCKTGSIVTGYLSKLLKEREPRILATPSLREILINPETNETWKAGDKIKRLKLAETLKVIAEQGPNALYNGVLTEKFVNDITNFGGIITAEDMKNYMVEWKEPVTIDLKDGMKMYSTPLPGSGLVVSIIMRILDGFLPSNLAPSTMWHRIIESFKHGYGVRTQLGDPEFVENITTVTEKLLSKSYIEDTRRYIDDSKTSNDPKFYGAEYINPEDHGTAHISILAPNGDAISVTSTINLILGAMVRSQSTGIILNDEMDDFSDPKVKNAFGVYPSPANYIVPGKRPFSSMCSTIVVDKKGDVRLIVGGAGGTKITTATTLVAIRNMWFGEEISTSIIKKRLHHQIFPMSIFVENGFDEEIIKDLTKKGHNYTLVDLSNGFAAVTAVARQCNQLFGFSDIRRNGSVMGF